MPKLTLREVLLQKTGWDVKGLSARVVRLRSQTPMDTSVAHAVLAHQAGINIARYLDPAGLQAAQQAIQSLGALGARATAPRARPSRSPGREGRVGTPQGRATGISVTTDGYKLADPLLPDEILTQAKAMAAEYARLHVLENSIRNVVQRVMRHEFGPDWWDQVMLRGSLKGVAEKAANRQKSEGQARWHQRRGEHPLDYTDFAELGQIIRAKQELFLPRFGVKIDWLNSFFDELTPSRNVVCHMNRLKEHNITGLTSRAGQWREMLEQQRAEIP